MCIYLVWASLGTSLLRATPVTQPAALSYCPALRRALRVALRNWAVGHLGIWAGEVCFRALWRKAEQVTTLSPSPGCTQGSAGHADTWMSPCLPHRPAQEGLEAEGLCPCAPWTPRQDQANTPELVLQPWPPASTVTPQQTMPILADEALVRETNAKPASGQERWLYSTPSLQLDVMEALKV